MSRVIKAAAVVALGRGAVPGAPTWTTIVLEVLIAEEGRYCRVFAKP